MPLEFYPDPLRFAAVIREKPISSVCMTAYRHAQIERETEPLIRQTSGLIS